MENKFINQTTLVGNSLLLFLLFLFVILVNTNVVCPPPNFILNSNNHSIETCSSNKRGDVSDKMNLFFNNESTNITTIGYTSGSRSFAKNEEIAESRKYSDNDSYVLDILTFSLIVPLGLTSLLMSLSTKWIVKIQDCKSLMGLLRKLRNWRVYSCKANQSRKFYFQIDSLKAIFVLISTSFWSICFTPIGVSMANWTDTCWISPLVCTIFSASLTGMIAMSAFNLDILQSFKFFLKKKRKFKSSRINTKLNEQPDSKNIYCPFVTCIVLAILTLIGMIFLSLSLYNSKFFPEDSDYAHQVCENEMYDLVIYLITVYSIMVIPVTVLLIYYGIQTRKFYFKKLPEKTNTHELDRLEV